MKKIESKYLFFFIFLTLSIIGGLLIFSEPHLFWDEGIYINNAKYIYSSGEQSTYENIRPPLFSLIIGLSIPLGIDIILFSKIFIFLCFILAIVFIYLISEKIKKDSGLFSAIILSTCSLILYILPHTLTDFIVLTFMLIAFYFFLSKKYFFTGLFCGISILLRFPSGLLLIIFGLFLITKDIKQTIKYWIFLILGALFFIAPYLLFNKILFNSFLNPIINAQLIVAQGSSSFFTTAWFFIKVLMIQNLILLFLIIFVLLIIFKKIKNKDYFLLLFVCLLYFIYFSQLPHYEERYIILLIPFGAIISGITISYFSKKLKTISYLLLFILLFITLVYSINNFITSNTDTEIRFIKDIKEIDTNILFISDPILGIYFDRKIKYMVNPYYTNQFLEKYPDFSYLIFSDRFLECDITCMDCGEINHCIETKKFKEIILNNWILIKTERIYGINYYIYKKITI